MQFLLMCCIDESLWAALPDGKRGQVMEDYGALMTRLHKSGHLLAGAKLDEPRTAVTVRQRNGKPSVTDGPFAETKEQFGGYHLLECKSQEEAIELASQIPTLPVGGTIEIRRVLELET